MNNINYNNISEEEINTTSEEITETEENTETGENTETENQQIIASNDVDETNIINEENGYYNYQNGLFQSIDTAKSTKLIPCNPGEIYYVTAKSKYVVAMVIYYDKDKHLIGYDGLCPEGTTELNYEEEKIVIPENCYYVVFQTHTSGELRIKYELANTKYIGYFERIDFSKFETAARHVFTDSTNKLNKIQITPESDADRILALGPWHTCILECSPGDRFIVSSYILHGDVSHLTGVALFIDENNNVISCVGKGTKNADITLENTLIIAPENAKYVAFNSYKHNVEKGVELEIKKFVCKKISDIIMDFDLVKYTNPLYGKRIYVDGDSIAQGDGAFGISFADIIAKKNNMILTKKAVGGTTLAINDAVNTQKDSNGEEINYKSIYERVISLDPENKPVDRFDFILLEGGANDMFSGTSLGELKEGYDLEVDNSEPPESGISNKFYTRTTIGATEAMCKFLYTHYFDTPKLFILIQRIFKDNIDTNTHFNGIKSALEKWKIPYIDLREETIFANWNDDFTYKWFKRKIDDNGNLVGDGTHPNRLAYEKFYVPIIEAKLKTLSL